MKNIWEKITVPGRPKQGSGSAEKRPVRLKQLKQGSYSVAFSAIALVIVIVANLFVGKLPASWIKKDLTDDSLYTLSEQTKQILNNLDMPVQVYLITERDQEDGRIVELLSRYQERSDRLTLEYVDPVINPNFVRQYTDASLSENSLIIVSEKRSMAVDFSEIYVTSYIDPNAYPPQSETTFNGEAELTAAIDYVTSDNLPILYALTGHGEMELSANLKSAIAKENMELVSLSLLTVEAVPEDADCLLLFSPQSDISEEERAKLLRYLEGGGKLLLVTDYAEDVMPNIAALMQNYGAETVEGVVIEGDTGRSLAGYPHYLLPMLGSHAITDPLIENGTYVLTPVAQGLRVLESYRSTLTITEVLTSSERSYSKADADHITTLEKEEGDIDGPFALGLAINETYDEVETKIVWLGSGTMLTDAINQVVAGGNADLFLNALGWMCEKESSITLRGKSLTYEYLVVSEAGSMIWTVVFVFVLPAASLVAGICIWVRRRKR